jgi:hypothetical protein
VIVAAVPAGTGVSGKSVPSTGTVSVGALTVTVAALLVLPSALAVTVVVPTPPAVKRPEESIVPTAELSQVHVSVGQVITLPLVSVQTAANACVPPRSRSHDVGEMVMDVRVGAAALTVTVAALLSIVSALAVK